MLGANEWAVLLLGGCAIPMSIRSLRLLTQHRILGVLMIILRKMLYDIALFLVVFTIVAVGFGLAFVGLLAVQAPWLPILAPSWEATISHAAQLESRGGDDAGGGGHVWNLISAMSVPFWAALGEPTLDEVQQASKCRTWQERQRRR